MSSPAQRTLAEARKRGWLAEVTERWNPHARVRHDLFGFVDVLALTGDGQTIAIQATSLSNVSARVRKIGDSTIVVARVRKAGWRIVVWGWGKGANGRYRLREVDVS